MSLGTLSIDIEARLARLEQGLDQAARANQRAADDVAARWSAAGTAIGTAFGALASVAVVQQFSAMAKATIDGLDALNDFSDATGTTVEMASALEDVALRTGTSLDTVAGILVKLNGVLADAKPGSAAAETLKRIGLDAAELRAQDPAEALRSVAVALSQYADDGNKARVVQDLFGKSVREAAPLLKDLAEKGALNATVTKEQAEQAERLNKAVAEFSKNAEDFKRGVLNAVLPALNEAINRFKAAREIFGAGAFFSAPFDEDLRIENALQGYQKFRDQVAKARSEVERYEQLRTKQGNFLSFIDEQGLARAKSAVEESQKYLQFYSKILGLQEGGGRGDTGRGLLEKPSIGGGSGGPDPKTNTLRETANAADKYAESLERAIQSAQGLSAVEEAQLALRGALAGATDSERTRILALSQALQDLKDAQKAAAAEKALEDRIKGLVAGTDTARILKAAEDIETLKKALDDPKFESLRPAIAEAIEQISESAKKTGEVVKETEDALKVFADQAARNIQSALGDTLYDTFKGSTDKLLDRWIDLLLRMVAEAKAADLAKALVGGDNEFGRWLGNLLGIGGKGSTGTGSATDVPAGVVSTKAVGVGASKASVAMSVQVVNNAGAAVSTQMSDDGTSLRVVIDQAVSEVERRIVSGGSTRKAIQSAFGVKPALARRG